MKTRSSSSSTSGSSPSRSAFAVAIVIHVYSLANLANANGSKPLNQLPRYGSTRFRFRSERVVSVLDFRAKGDGLTDDTQAFKDAWDIACSLSSRSRIEIPAGRTYLVRPIDFHGPCSSKVMMKIAGTIVAPQNPDVWDGLDPRKWLYFSRIKHLTVEGEGTIDGMGQEWWLRSCKVNKTNPCQHAPTAITFHGCKNLKFKNLMVKNSQQMHVVVSNCVRVMVSNLKVYAPANSPNTDGIHISASTRVKVEDSVVKTGDDCVSIVSKSSAVKIKNIACGPGHGISIGSLGKSQSWGQVYDVNVDGATISNTKNGVRIKTWQGGQGFASNIVFENVWMENVSNPIIIDQYYCDSRLPCVNQTSAVKVEDISFKNIKGTSATDEAIRFACSSSYPCERIYLEDIILVSTNEKNTTRSFCWEAYGSISGVIEPPPCFYGDKPFIQQKIQCSPVRQSI